MKKIAPPCYLRSYIPDITFLAKLSTVRIAEIANPRSVLEFNCYLLVEYILRSSDKIAVSWPNTRRATLMRITTKIDE